MDDLIKVDNLDVLIDMAKLIGEMFRPNCEVAISNLSKKPGQIVFIYNGKVTGRKVGDRLNKETQNRLKDLNNIRQINYMKSKKFIDNDIKASTLIIDVNGVKYSFCINYDCTNEKILADQFKSFLFMKSDAIDDQTNLDKNESFIQKSVEQELIRENISSLDIKKSDRLKIIKNLYDKDIFSIDKSVKRVSKELGVSRYTIYNDLKALNLKI